VAPREVHPLKREGARRPLPTSPLTGGDTPVLARGACVGFYLHIPFCTRRCEYCSFTTAPVGARDAVERYVEAIRREIALLAAAPLNAAGVAVETVFFGGGTPSLLDPDQLGAILADVRERFRLLPGAEVTVECNPESVDVAKLRAYRAAGVNRISLGVQSLDDAVLAAIGRLHDAHGARRAFEAVRDAGFDNVSLDLMYGLPGLSEDLWSATIAGALDWEPDHLSAYALTLDGGSAWGVAGPGGLPPEETTVAQYWALAGAAGTRGFEHYEISNYARPGARSRHNQIYWRRGEYLACGTGACGFVGDVRWSNLKALPRYAAAVDAGELPADSSERLSDDQALGEALMLGLRTSDGVPSGLLERRVATAPALAGTLQAWEDRGLLSRRNGSARLTEAGFLLSDGLFVELL
jgi:oxygen-independent coproporphyrinogen-3 oxidase